MIVLATPVLNDVRSFKTFRKIGKALSFVEKKAEHDPKLRAWDFREETGNPRDLYYVVSYTRYHAMRDTPNF